VEVRRRNRERDAEGEITTIQNLKWCMFQQISHYQAQSKRVADAEIARSMTGRAQDAEQRFYSYFPEEKKSMAVLIAEFHKREAELQRRGSTKARPDDIDEN